MDKVQCWEESGPRRRKKEQGIQYVPEGSDVDKRQGETTRYQGLAHQYQGQGTNASHRLAGRRDVDAQLSKAILRQG